MIQSKNILWEYESNIVRAQKAAKKEAK